MRREADPHPREGKAQRAAARSPVWQLRRLALAALASTCLCAAWLAYSPAPSQAALVFPSLGEIKGPAPGQTFRHLFPESVAVNDFNGHVLVADSGVGLVYDFESSGDTEATVWDGSNSPAGSFGKGRIAVAVDNSTGAVFVADATDRVIDKFDATGELIETFAVKGALDGSQTPAGSFSPPSGEGDHGTFAIAVDEASHDLYVIDAGHEVVDVFSAQGEYLEAKSVTERPGSLYGCSANYTDGIAVSDFSEQLLLSSSCGLELFRFGLLSRSFIEPALGPFGGGYTAVAANSANGRIYVVESSPDAVKVLSAEGSPENGEIAGVPSSANPGVSVDQATGDVYVSDNSSNSVKIFSGGLEVPEVLTGEASNVTLSSATLNGTVNPEGAGAATCLFQWGPGQAFDQTAPCSAAVPDGNTPVEVHADLSGLQRDVEYCLRLLASNANGANTAPAQCFTTAGPAVHGQASVSEVTSESVSFQATIDPNNAATSYRFDYGTTTAYGSSVPVPPASLGSAKGDVKTIPQHVKGLSPNTVYHYRLVVLSSFAGTPIELDGPDQAFTTQPASNEAALPDNRSWELVSPPDKHGALISPIKEIGVIQAAANGDAITYLATAATEDQPPGNAVESQLLSTRDAAGWGTHDIASPHDAASGQPTGIGQYDFFSADLSLAALQPAGPFSPSVSTEASEGTAYLRTDFSNGREVCPTAAQRTAGVSCYRPLVTSKPGFANVPEGDVFSNEAEGGNAVPQLAGASPDLHHVLVESSYSLTAPGKTATAAPGLYEWSAGMLTFLGEAEQRGVESVSTDGSRVVFRPHGLNALLLRDVPLGQTLRLDLPQPDCLAKATCGEGTSSPAFSAATADGLKVFFTDTQRLTADAGAPETADLYECDLVVQAGMPRCELRDLTPPSATKEDANVRRMLGMSSDGERVYLVASGNLATGAASGSDNLYVRNAGVTKLVAVLSNDDEPDWSIHAQQPVRVSATGEWLAFMSDASLTGYDNRDVTSGRPDEEVFLYRATTGTLVCASCNPTGARPAGAEYDHISANGVQAGLVGGNKVWPERQWIAANVPAWTPYVTIHAAYQSRYLSESGRLFFNAGDALVPQDVNHTEDVYEYEPPGVGGCTTASASFSERSGGCVRLISSGTSPEESGFVDASETGGDVFFLTSARLSAQQDIDTSIDVYDAHACTSASPCLPEATTQPPCDSGDACKPAPSPQPPIFGASGSATFSGAGNPIPGAATSKPLTNQQKLAKALRLCRRKHRTQRVACEHRARRRYGPHHKARRSAHSRPGGGK